MDLRPWTLSFCSPPAIYQPPFTLEAQREEEGAKVFEILYPLHLDLIYGCVFIDDENGNEVLLADSLCDGGGSFKLFLEDVPDEACVQILGIQSPHNRVVAEFVGIAQDLRLADRIQLSEIQN